MSRRSLDRTRTLLELGPWLVQRGTATVREAAQEFGLTPEQVEADVRLLNTMEVPGIGDGVDYGYATAASVADGVITVDRRDSRLSATTSLTADEAAAMLVAVEALAALPGVGREDAVQSVRRKLGEALREVTPAGEIAVELAQDVDTGVLEPLRHAMLDDRQVHLSYLVVSRDELTERVVDPLRVGTQDGRWYLQAWCHLAGGLRQFRLEHVRDLQVLDTRRRVLPDDVDLGEIGEFQPTSSALQITLELEPAGRWVGEYHPVEEVEELPDGRQRVRMFASSPEWAVALALRLGAQGRVVAPASVASRVSAEARRALARYPHG